MSNLLNILLKIDGAKQAETDLRNVGREVDDLVNKSSKGLRIDNSQFKSTINELERQYSQAVAKINAAQIAPKAVKVDFAANLRNGNFSIPGLQAAEERLRKADFGNVALQRAKDRAEELAAQINRVTDAQKRMMKLQLEGEAAGRLRSADFGATTPLLKFKKGEWGGEITPKIDTQNIRNAESAVRGVGTATKFTAQQMTMLSYQVNDAAVQLAGGQNPLLIFLQQGSQVAPLFGGWVGFLKQIAPLVAGIGAAFGPVLASLKGASIGNAVSEQIAEIGKQAKAAGLSIEDLNKYLNALSGTGSGDQKEIAAAFSNLRQQAFASRDAYLKEQKDYKKKLSETDPSEQYKIAPPKAPDDIFKKLGVDLRNFKGDTDSVITQLQTAFQKLGDPLQKNEFKRIVEEKFQKPIAELVEKTPGQIEAINAAFAKIVPPLSQNDVDLANKLEKQKGIVEKITSDLGKQVDAAFMPVADAFNKFKFNLVTSGENFKGFMENVRSVSASMADFWKILSGDEQAKKNSPWVAVFIQTFDSIIRLADAAGQSLGVFFDLTNRALQEIKLAGYGIKEVWLEAKKATSWGDSGEINKAIAANKEAIKETLKKVEDENLSKSLANRGDKILADLFGKQSSPASDKSGDLLNLASKHEEAKKATDEHTAAIKNQSKALTEATEYTQKYNEGSSMGAGGQRVRDPRLGNNGYGFGKEAQYVNDPKANPDYYRSDDEYKTIAERQRLERIEYGNQERQNFLNRGGKASDLSANDQVQLYKQQNPGDNMGQVASNTQAATAAMTQFKEAASQAATETAKIKLPAVNKDQKQSSAPETNLSTAAADAADFKISLIDINDALKNIGSAVGSAISPLAGALDTAKTAASNLADQLQRAASAASSIKMPSSSDSGSAPKMASGGIVRGPGTSRSDSILTWLSNGEFVMSAAAVNSIGVGTLSAMNSGIGAAAISAPGFADGGPVGGGYSPPAGLAAMSGSASASGGSNLTVVLDNKAHGPFSGSAQDIDSLGRAAAAKRATRTSKIPSRVG